MFWVVDFCDGVGMTGKEELQKREEGTPTSCKLAGAGAIEMREWGRTKQNMTCVKLVFQ
ncbi:MAG: hypothetical protein KKF98_06270 [Bacteroidetes bacterium]|nr:hypothetical protein [Bacteroidota bacterium]